MLRIDDKYREESEALGRLFLSAPGEDLEFEQFIEAHASDELKKYYRDLFAEADEARKNGEWML